MNEQREEGYRDAARATIGSEGRMISPSKSGYRQRHPDRATVFNANVCVSQGKIWHGDLDLTVDEPKLVALAAQIGETLYVLYEYDGRFEHEEKPLLERAVYSVTPTRHNRVDYRVHERARDGTLRLRPAPPESRRRFVLTYGWPRLVRFWHIERSRRTHHSSATWEKTTLIYVGERRMQAFGRRRSPLLVLGLFRHRRWQAGGIVELTWYPTGKGHAPRPLLQISRIRQYGRVRPHLRACIHPGYMYEIQIGVTFHARRADW